MIILPHFFFIRPNVCEQRLYQQIEDMSWSENMTSNLGGVSQEVQGDDNSTNDFDDIANSLFTEIVHGRQWAFIDWVLRHC